MRQTGVAAGERCELGEDFGGRFVIHGEPKPTSDVADDSPVFASFAGRFQHRASDLDSAVGVGVRAGFFEVATGWQNDVGELGGLGQEDVLHDQEVESRQSLPNFVAVRV